MMRRSKRYDLTNQFQLAPIVSVEHVLNIGMDYQPALTMTYQR